ncbi:SDR family NAD(P)-dependent oxidoreductase [Chitinibacteraceae bacterium HSL-7]
MMLPSLNPRWRDWQGRRVWLVGASSGIGAALAARLLAAGARVALTARNAERLARVGGGRALLLPFDATSPAAWQTAQDQLDREWGGVDLVLFCAAIYQPERAWELDAARTRQTLDVNLGSVYYGLEVVLPGLIKHSGSIAIVASVAGYMGLPGATVYGPGKAALINLAELLYADLHPRGVGVYLINPGFVRTRLTDQNRFAMPVLLTPEEAADAILAGFARGAFEIDFPRRFTRLMRAVSLLPYRWRFALMNRTLKLQ